LPVTVINTRPDIETADVLAGSTFEAWNAAGSSALSVYQRWGEILVIVSSFTLQP
jgi:hypothetical protein